jgi:hypothetical protein
MSVARAFSVLLLGCAMAIGISSLAQAQCASPPNTLANGNPTDATQVMGNFNHLTTCLNSGQLTVPPVSSLSVTGTGGGTVTINNPVNTSPYTLSLPAGTGAAGQYLSTDGAGQTSWAYATATAPPPLVDGIPVGRPAATSLSWLNQGGATYTDYLHGPISISLPASSGDELRGLGQTPPGSTPYTLTAKLDMLLWGDNYSTAGIYICDSTGKLTVMHEQGSTGNPAVIQVNHYSSTSSYSGNAKSVDINGQRTLWLRVTNDGTNWNFYISHNGADWSSIYSEALTAYLGPTISSIGVVGDNHNSSAPVQHVSIWSFELGTGTGTNSSWQ